MKIRRFTGTDMRDAMRQVSKALGPDAVILESGKVDGGVTISAAIDFDPVAYDRNRSEAQRGSRIDRTVGDDETFDAVAGNDAENAATPIVTGTEVADWTIVNQPATDLRDVRQDVQSIRCLLEAQLSRLIWNERERRTPELAATMRKLSRLGLEPDIVNRLIAELGEADLATASWTTPLRQLVRHIPVCANDLIDGGGVFAVVGATGVGKTTSIAKLAARYAMHHDAADIALVTLDTYKIGAREQLETFGQILGVPVHQITDADSLATTLAGLSDKKLVLIDTAGMSQRDARLDGQLKLLADAEPGIGVLLAVPANLHTDTMQEVVTAFRDVKPAGCILTKIDEATSLGGALSVLMRAQIPLAYVANGQRVPEDLHCAHARQAWLVKAAVELMRPDQAGASDEYMAQHFGEVA